MQQKEAKENQVVRGVDTGSKQLGEARARLDAYLEEKKLRKTTERYVVLETIYQMSEHFSVDDLWKAIKQRNKQVSRATTYNCLDLFVACKLVVRHLFDREMALYERALHFGQHDHLICVTCKRIMEFCDPRIRQIEAGIGDFFSQHIVKHSLFLYGECQKSDCAHKTKG